MTSLLLSRRSVTSVFFANGAIVASWSPHIPFVKEKLELTDGQLGIAFLAMATGALVAMLGSGPLAAHIGAHRATVWGSVALVLALPLPALAPSFIALVGALTFMGLALGMMDVSMNTVAADVEKSGAKPIMSFFHAMFSVGAIAGAGAAALLLWLGATPLQHMTGAAVAIAVGLIWPLAALPDTRLADAVPASKKLVFPRGKLLLIGLLAFAAMASEGSVFDWGSTMLRYDFGAEPYIAAVAFGSFQVTMAAVRFVGDAAKNRFGAVAVMGAGGALSALGLGFALLVATPWAGLVGFALMGLGLGNAVPLVFSGGAERGESSGQGIAAVATLGYLGFLLGPPIIGSIADATSLPSAMLFVVALCLLLAFGARSIAAEPREGAPAS